jgi:hypothetical protein
MVGESLKANSLKPSYFMKRSQMGSIKVDSPTKAVILD